MDYPEAETQVVLEAETVFLLMKKGFPISRNVRAQWKIEHLNSVVTIEKPVIDNEETQELEIVSVLPKDKPTLWSSENSHQFLYRICSSTSIVFLAHKYKMVFCLDLSPSLATIDIQNDQVVIDEVCLATKRCLEGITRPFFVPGSTRLMKPEIYVTVIAHTPFFSNPAQQVLVQGWLATMENIGSLMHFIETQLNIIEEKVAHVTGVVNQQLENLRAENEKLVGGLFEEGSSGAGNNNNNNSTNNNMSIMSMVSPETSFVNMLRYGMLALSLLPDHSCAHLVIVTDGIVGISDANVMDSVIQQLRATTVACSFLHVGSLYHSHCANGLVPYEDLLIFLSTATLGTYFSFIPQPVPIEEVDLNIYHKNFLCWQLYRAICLEKSSWNLTDWHMKQFLFHSDDFPQLLRKKQIDEKVKCTLSSLLCCRLREGYLIKRINLREDFLEICFILPWRNYVFLEFSISCPWQKRSMGICNTITYTITLEATYEFLHDITCLSKKPLKSSYRQKVVSRFWAALTSLTESDNFLSHFSWSPGIGWTWYNVPDTIKSGMPVFYLPTYPSSNAIQLSDAACPQFGQIWQPLVSLEPHQWARWMHCQRITLILCHDKPLPKHLHQANQSGRFQSVQYRQAAAALYGMLKNWATFVLVDNHTYVQFIYRELDKPPISFSIIHVNCRALSVVLNIAFAGGTEGIVRHNVVTDLLERLSKLTLPSRPTDQKEIPCCTIIHKSLAKILIRYDRMPTDLNTVKFLDSAQFLPRNSLIPSGNLASTLSTYLHHERWLWFIKKPFVQSIPAINLPKLNISAIARILSTITKIRLSEGFNFAYSSAGIINMVREVQMRGPENDTSLYPCTIQYILFPPHMIVNPLPDRDSGTDDTDEGEGEGGTEDCENIGDFQIITEIWVEPQCGHVQIPLQHKTEYLHCLQYHQLPDAIAYIDEECINALLTLEHLSLLSQVAPSEKNLDILTNQGYLNQGLITRSIKKPLLADFLEGPPSNQERIHSVNFLFDTLNILPKCQQAELLFSMFDDGIHNNDTGDDNANRILIEGFLDHIKHLHNRELILTPIEFQKFTEMVFNRPRDEESQIPYFQPNRIRNKTSYPQWRCFVKGISVTHVIITILPATEKDVRLLMYPEEDIQDSYLGTDSNVHYESLSSNFDLRDTLTPVPYARSHNETESLSPFHNFDDFNSNVSSRTTTAHSTPKMETYQKLTEENSKHGLILPIYVYDCSLALLIDALVDKLPSPRARDIYRDYTFRIGEHFQEEFINLKPGGDTKPSSPEPKSEDSDNVLSDQKSLMEHCKILSLAHCRCYVMAVYKSLILQRSLSYEDMEAAVEQCEENYMEINITDYLRSVCKHLSTSSADKLHIYTENISCNEIQPFHNLIKNKFERIINVAFRPVPAHPKLYYCLPSWQPERMNHADLQNTDSDDELEEFTFHSEIVDCKMNSCAGKVNANSVTWPAASNHNEPQFSSSESTESFISDLHIDSDTGKEHPLFLQLNCSVRNRSSLSSTPVKLLPTCVTEIMQNFDNYEDYKVTLDIICLYLPKEVLEVSIDCSPGLRTTSFCSASPHGSLGAEHSNSIGNGTDFSEVEAVQAGLTHLPHYQYTAIVNLKEEIDWLLQDETATALLDKSSPTEDSLNFVARHVAESNDRTSCYTEKVPLHFVFPSENSVPKFLEELTKLEINRYCIRQEGSFFYFVKNLDQHTYNADSSGEQQSEGSAEQNGVEDEVFPEIEKQESTQGSEGRTKKQDSGDPPGYLSEISSIGEGQIGTDDGYDGDSSDSEDECQWLIEMDKRRKLLPNFWLILRVETTHVNVYFHCRFLELASTEVSHYQQIQKLLVAQIKAICRRVNQYLLLHRLHDTRLCDPLLEPESSEDHNWKADSFSEGSGIISHNTAINVTPGMFRCPIVWEMPFCLHPRLKTGPGRSGMSRGIKALHAVLNRLSANNRSNMFVYREKNDNVFYLRLHEQNSEGKSLQNKLSESDEKLVVSRSSSIASLSQARGTSLLSEQSTIDDTRPRVRSFGEKESDILNKTGDSIVLMIHGISEAGPEIKCELVQVLQNRLDDAVLEVLSVMLARNPMCKLTPADVHFIQKPYRSPENILRLNVQSHCLTHMCALGYYLRQNVLQFLYIPKYTDPRAHYHFQDYSQPENSIKRIPESDIFLYNQSHSSGSRGIACIAMGIVNTKGELIAMENNGSRASPLPESLSVQNFENIVLTSLYDVRIESATQTEALIEFRIWKQGRVNLESLIQKLRSAVRHAIWDLVTEYNFLPTLLTVPLKDEISEDSVQNPDSELNPNPDSELNPNPDSELNPNTDSKSSLNSEDASQTVDAEVNQTEVEEEVKSLNNEESNENIENLDSNKAYELGEKGKLHKMYHATLPFWFQFALDINVPAIKKHVVTLETRHSLAATLRELQNIIHNNASDTSTRTFVQSSRQPFINDDMEEDPLAFKSFEGADNINSAWLKKAQEQENKDECVYLPCDFFKEEHAIYVKNILIARNFQQWKASFAQTIEPENLVPKDQKLLQKFNPLILETSFVPRQRLLLAKIQSKNIVIYMYNWSKERSEKLIKQATNLGTWLSSRSTLYSNIIMQKLGIFNHEPSRSVDQRDQNESTQFQITDMESLAKFPQASPARIQSAKSTSFSWNHLMGQVMRDAKPNAQHLSVSTDPVVKAAYDFQELQQREKKRKEDLNRLYTMWQSKNTVPNIPISAATLETFKQHSRLIHYCHTPLLFLPEWRLKSAATRDHSLTSSSSNMSDSAAQSNPEIRKSKDADGSSQADNEWHNELCFQMLTEYKQYLQILGFNPIQTESTLKSERENVQNQTFYLKKSMLGGILLFEIHLSEPFFTVKLRVIECSRLQDKANSALVNQFMLSFIDACDEIVINMHLHSFTYDFHLRLIHSYIAGTGNWSLRHGYHLTNFLDDFNKYYSKAPNYARNLLYNGVITINNLATPARTLYSYLLSHEKAYGMQVFAMTDDSDEGHECEYVLVKLQSTPLVSYCDAQDTKYTDDFDVALIVSRIEEFSNSDSNEITLKYYLMLTSKRELYPKRDLENNKLGKFRTVHGVGKTNSQVESPSESSPASTTMPSSRKHSKCELKSSYSDLQENVAEMSDFETKEEEEENFDDVVPETKAPTPPPVPSSPLTQSILGASTSNLNMIRRESINYLGYYSSHEQLMQELIMSQAQTAREHITSMIEQGAVHCRTHLLWNKLLENKSSMSYAEFTELRSLAIVEPFSALDSRLSPLVSQPMSWYQALAKVLQNKYQDYHKQFNTPDGNVTHHLILHPSYVQAFMMLTIDLHTSRGDLCAVYRNSVENTSSPFSVGDIYNLVEGFVNACCFHLWMGLYN